MKNLSYIYIIQQHSSILLLKWMRGHWRVGLEIIISIRKVDFMNENTDKIILVGWHSTILNRIEHKQHNWLDFQHFSNRIYQTDSNSKILMKFWHVIQHDTVLTGTACKVCQLFLCNPEQNFSKSVSAWKRWCYFYIEEEFDNLFCQNKMASIQQLQFCQSSVIAHLQWSTGSL